MNAQALDMSKLKAAHLSRAPEDLYRRMVEAQKTILESDYAQKPDTSKNPAYQNYAKVMVGGKVVAEIDNHGYTTTSNSIGAKLQDQLPNEAGGVIQGPKLAQARAEFIAEMLGGEVVKSSTALTQNQFRAIPPIEMKVDVAAMQEDPRYEELQKLQQARTAFLAQQIAQENGEDVEVKVQPENADAIKEKAQKMADEAKEKFLDYMSKTPEERYYEAILREMGLTKEELAALPPDERAKIEEKIKEEIAQRMADNMSENEKEKEQAA